MIYVLGGLLWLETIVMLYLYKEMKEQRKAYERLQERSQMERNDLYDRLMSKDIAQYRHKDSSKGNKPKNFLKSSIDENVRQRAYDSMSP